MKTKIFLIALIVSQIAYSQTIYKSSIDNGGASISNTNIQMIYTIGEVNVQEATVGNIGLSEGFIDPNLIIILEDIEPPVLLGVPADITVECSSDIPENPEVTAIDNVTENVLVEYSEVWEDGTCINDYVITKIWTASDDFGNTTSQSQVVTVSDNTPPIITIPENVTLECDMLPDSSNTGFATAIDNCTENVIVTHDDVFVGDCGNTGVITRTWTATDECGNTSTGVQTITIVDTQAPVIAGLPEAGTIYENDPDQCGAVIDFTTVTASDNCSNSVALSFEPSSGSLFSVGTTQVIITASDACGNAMVEHFDVIVADTQYPTIEAPT